MATPKLSRQGIHYDLQRRIVSALAKSVRNFRKHPHFSSAWDKALRNLRQQDPREYRNALDFVGQLLKEFDKTLHRTSKDTVALSRLFLQVVCGGRSCGDIEENLRRLARCSEPECKGVDPAWDAVYEQILLGRPDPDQLQPITRSFDDLLQVRGLNLRREITAFLQREFPAQFVISSKREKIGQFGLPTLGPIPPAWKWESDGRRGLNVARVNNKSKSGVEDYGTN